MLSAIRRMATLPARGFAPAMYRQVVVAPAVRAFCAAPQVRTVVHDHAQLK